jgi:hypothetical protein
MTAAEKCLSLISRPKSSELIRGPVYGCAAGHDREETAWSSEISKPMKGWICSRRRLLELDGFALSAGTGTGTGESNYAPCLSNADKSNFHDQKVA